MIELIFWLLCGHAVADFALQSQAMAKGKSRYYKPDAILKGQKYIPCWMYWLSAHALIHGLAITLIMPCGFAWKYGLVATGLHWVIDFIKCENWTNPHIDQLLHGLCLTGFVLHFRYF